MRPTTLVCMFCACTCIEIPADHRPAIWPGTNWRHFNLACDQRAFWFVRPSDAQVITRHYGSFIFKRWFRRTDIRRRRQGCDGRHLPVVYTACFGAFTSPQQRDWAVRIARPSDCFMQPLILTPIQRHCREWSTRSSYVPHRVYHRDKRNRESAAALDRH